MESIEFICYGKLVVRKGKYEEFLGCSNYPKCKFTETIKIILISLKEKIWIQENY